MFSGATQNIKFRSTHWYHDKLKSRQMDLGKFFPTFDTQFFQKIFNHFLPTTTFSRRNSFDTKILSLIRLRISEKCEKEKTATYYSFFGYKHFSFKNNPLNLSNQQISRLLSSGKRHSVKFCPFLFLASEHSLVDKPENLYHLGKRSLKKL